MTMILVLFTGGKLKTQVMINGKRKKVIRKITKNKIKSV